MTLSIGNFSVYTLAFVAICGQASAETQTFDLIGFDGVSAAHGIQVIVDVGEPFSVEAESTNADHLEKLQIDTRNDTLRVRRSGLPFSLTGTEDWNVTVRVSMPALDHADASSGSNLVIDEVTASQLEVTASGGARVEITDGSCDALAAASSGGASLDLGQVECESVRADASTGANIDVFANRTIEADASTGGMVRVIGTYEESDVNTNTGGTVRLD